MKKDMVIKVDNCCNYADITLKNNSGAITVLYKLCLPEHAVVKANRNSNLKPGDFINILSDNGKDIAYLYNGYAFLVGAPKNCRDFVKSLSFADQVALAPALYKKVLESKQIPSIMTYKNLQKMVAKYGLVRE